MVRAAALFTVCAVVCLFHCEHVACCGGLHFPLLRNFSTITFWENDTIDLPFSLILDNECVAEQFTDYTIDISKQTGLLCLITQYGSDCIPSSNCSCIGNGSFQLVLTADRNYGGQWSWLFEVPGVTKSNGTFNVIIAYPAKVENVNLTPQQPLERGSEVQIECSFANGNPPVTAFLTDTKGTLLTSVDAAQTDLTSFAYTYHNISCANTGTVRCEAPGASENGTATLLVKCPPDFQDDHQTISNDGDHLIAVFGIRSHSKDMKGCRLKSPSRQESDCLSSVNVTSSPPDLTVILHLDTLSPSDEGTWHLNLTNSAGSAVITFNLTRPKTTTVFIGHSATPDGRERTPQGEEDERLTTQRDSTKYILSAVGVVAAGVIIIAAVGAGCFFRRRKASDRMRRYLTTRRAGMEDFHGDEDDVYVRNIQNEVVNGSARCLIQPDTPLNGARQSQYVFRPEQCHPELGATPELSAIEAPAQNVLYVDVKDIQNRKKQKNAGCANPGSDNPEYVDVNDIQKRKRPKKAAPESNYVDAKDIQERKRQVKKDRENISSEESSPSLHDDFEKDGGPCSSVEMNADGLLYVQLDFSGRKARNVVVKPLPKTDYAEVNFKARPPPPPPDE